MNKLVGNAKSQTFKLDNGKMESVHNYFVKQYNFKIEYPNLPLVHVGNPKGNNYLPIELLEIKQQVCPQSKILGKVLKKYLI